LQGDRFIPSTSDVEAAHYTLTAAGAEGADVDGFKRSLASSLLENAATGGSVDGGDAAAPARVLAFKTKAPAPVEGYSNGLRSLYTANRAAAKPAAAATRHIASTAERILDAPELVDDYYLNLLDWGTSNNVLAVGLGASVYLWNAATGGIEELMHTASADDHITSVSWVKEAGNGYLAVGTASADVQVWDVEKARLVRTMKGHAGRVGALDWNGHILASGSRDASIFTHDVRIREHHIATLAGHSQEVCQVKWSHDGSMLASGGNDNLLCLWDAASCTAAGSVVGSGPRVVAPKFSITDHQAAVKALAWCPWQKGLLASGAGTADRCIKVWNAPAGALLNSVDTGSQVCSLLWNPNDRELLSSHGFSQNQLCLWKYPTMAKVKELEGHTARVLHMAAGPDGTVCSAGADETLRFWRVFGESRPRAAKAVEAGSPAMLRGAGIR
jgi:cell division cycle protein 20 (cofactor of APC complex)